MAGIDLYDPCGGSDVVPVHAAIVADRTDHNHQFCLSRPFLRFGDIIIIKANMSIDRPAGVEPSAFASRGFPLISYIHIVVSLPAFQTGVDRKAALYLRHVF